MIRGKARNGRSQTGVRNRQHRARRPVEPLQAFPQWPGQSRQDFSAKLPLFVFYELPRVASAGMKNNKVGEPLLFSGKGFQPVSLGREIKHTGWKPVPLAKSEY
jgi:hypothetical protein